MMRTHLAIVASTLLASTSASLANTNEHTVPSFIKEKPGVREALPGVRSLQIDHALRRRLKEKTADGSTIRVTSIPLPDGTTIDADLRMSDPFPEGFQLEMAPGVKSRKASTFVDPDDSDMIFFKGNVTGDPKSFVFLAHYEDRIHGLIERDGRTFLLSSDTSDRKGPPLIFDPIDLPDELLQNAQWECETHQADIGPIMPELPEGGAAGATATCRVVKLAFELDYELVSGPLESNGLAVLFYLGAVLTISDEVYRRDSGVGLEFSYGRAWYEETDPWDQGGTLSQLTQFRDYWNINMVGTERDVAVLLSGRSLGGGRAWDIGTLCTIEDSYNVCGNMAGGFPYPAEDNHDDNWDLFVFMHELGHNLGASHTHAYSPPLDDCSSGGCTTPPNGTIMSYCHLCIGGYANIILEFHPNVANLINANVVTAACLEEVDATLIANDDSATTYYNTAKRIEILLNDEASCSQPRINAFVSASTEGGMIDVLPGEGTYGQDVLRYIPPVDFTGTDTFIYQARDDLGNLDLATVTVEVIDQPEIGEEYLVVDQFDRSVRRIDAYTFVSRGYFLPAYNTDLGRPRSIAVLPNGDVLIGDDLLNQVLRFDGLTGSLQGVFFEDPVLETCEAIVVHDGEVFMLDYVNARIFKTDLDGNSGVMIFEGSGTGLDMAISPTGELWVTGTVNGFVAMAINPSTGSITHSIIDILDIGMPSAVTFGDGLVQVADASTGAIVRISPTGSGTTVQWVLNAFGAAATGLGAPMEFAEGPEYGTPTGRTALADKNGCFEFNEAGSYTATMDLANTNTFDSPWAIAYREAMATSAADLTKDGKVNGADLGLLLAQFGSQGTADFDNNGVVDGADLGYLLAEWTG